VEKLYVQDVVERALLEEWLGVALDPATTHVYLCGNPAMIGLPQWEGDQPRFPDTPGTCELLAGLGFDLDRHGHVGNVHTEKYW
jgi:ferredoxin--NADP+ reductase